MREAFSEKITVVIPVYNVEPYLRQCLDSVVNQTYQNLEIIVIDDGSPDHCGAICDEYMDRDERIKAIHKENAGVSAARNDGIETATGKWILFIDADDWIDNRFVENMFKSLPAESVDVLIAGGYIEEYSTKSVPIGSFHDTHREYRGDWKNLLIEKVLAPNLGEKKGNRFATVATAWNKLYRTSFLRENNLRFHTKLHPQEDVLFCLGLFEKAQEVAVSDCIGYHYRQGIKSSALHRFNENWPYMGQVFLNEVKRLKEANPADESFRKAVLGRTAIFTTQILQCYFFHSDNKNSYRVTQKELKQYKSHPLVKEFIGDNGRDYLSSKQAIMKCFLRLPWLWPIRLLCISNQRAKRK